VTEPPTGAAPPATVELETGEILDLRALAEEVCRRYRAEFPDEQERYGDAGQAWCVHDNQYLINWAVVAANGYGGFEAQLAWLADVLEARDFPLDRLARNLEIAATVVDADCPRHRTPSEILADGARLIRSR
jgi:hypothetical protein